EPPSCPRRALVGLRAAPAPAGGGSPAFRPVALLVLLPGPARARIVATDLGRVALDGLDLGVLAARGGRAVGVVDVAWRAARAERGRSPPERPLLGSLRRLLLAHGLQLEEVLGDLDLDAL